MVFLTKPNIFVSNLGLDVFNYVMTSRVSLGLSVQFRCCNKSFITISDRLSDVTKNGSTKNFSTMPVLLKSKSVQLFRPVAKPFVVSQGLSLTLCGHRSIMSRNHSVYFHPLVQYSSIESRTRITGSSLLYPEQRRYKTSKKSPKRPEYDSDSDTDDEEVIQGTKVSTIRLQSLRTDGVLKKALNVARNKVEAAFYGGHIRVNGEKPMKKSHQLKIGDEIDLIRGVSPVNPDLLSISRVEIVSVRENDEDDELLVKVRRTKSLYIENYTTDPWKKGTTEQDT